MLKNHLNKCRCCFEELSSSEIPVKITKNIEKKFFAVTQIELKSSESYSKFICECCSRELDGFYAFKKSLVDKQLKLYQMKNNDVLNVKSEPTSEPPEFVSFTPSFTGFDSSDDNDDNNDFQDDFFPTDNGNCDMAAETNKSINRSTKPE